MAEEAMNPVLSCPTQVLPMIPIQNAPSALKCPPSTFSLPLLNLAWSSTLLVAMERDTEQVGLLRPLYWHSLYPSSFKYGTVSWDFTLKIGLLLLLFLLMLLAFLCIVLQNGETSKPSELEDNSMLTKKEFSQNLSRKLFWYDFKAIKNSLDWWSKCPKFQRHCFG